MSYHATIDNVLASKVSYQISTKNDRTIFVFTLMKTNQKENTFELLHPVVLHQSLCWGGIWANLMDHKQMVLL
jgi:hypothetical protein